MTRRGKMIYFRSDYSLGAPQKIIDALIRTNLEHTDGYAEDEYSYRCADMIREMIGKPDAHVHFMVGGTPTNTVTISAALRPYEGVISPDTGHIYRHETGSVEANGHRVFAAPTEDGKLTPEAVDAMMVLHEDEHCVKPKMAYITHPTENGGVYTKAELKALRETCDRHGLYLYMDGARLGTALVWPGNDLSLKDIAELTDAFYIGGTKIGALFGEALIILNEEINYEFRYMIKRSCTLLAKGRLIAVQLQALLEGKDGGADIESSLYLELSRHENEMAIKIAEGAVKKGYELWLPHQTNQVFVIMDNDKIKELEENFFFYTWCPYDETRSVIRLITNWNTKEEEVKALLEAL